MAKSGFRSSRTGEPVTSERTREIMDRANKLPDAPIETEKKPAVKTPEANPAPAETFVPPIEFLRKQKEPILQSEPPRSARTAIRTRAMAQVEKLPEQSSEQAEEHQPSTGADTENNPTITADSTKTPATQQARKKPDAPAAQPSAVAKRQAERASRKLKIADKHTHKLGEVLLEKGIINQEQLLLALEEQGYTREKLGDILVRLSFLKKQQLINILMQLNPESLIGDQELETEIPTSVLIATKTAVFGDAQNILYVATINNPDEVLEELAKHTSKEIHFVEISHRAISDQLRETEKRTRNVTLQANEEDAGRIFAGLLREAIGKHASDIHLDPGERVMYVRLRIDGEVHFIDRLLPSIATKIVALIKNKANLDVSQSREPQDGGFSVDGRDFRVATLPAGNGEKITIRILDREKALIDVRQLGMTKIDEWVSLAQKQNGLVLVCGATGSGKTTTLYSTMQYVVDRLHETAFTIEDPIEYRLPFISQVQINEKAGLTYPRFMKTVLRHDPDTILVGEIRDRETCEYALIAADTGHLVYSTLHTNDVRSTLTRLKGLGAEDLYLASVLRGILVQRLAKKYCDSCAGKGCGECMNTGMRGRILVGEYCQFDEIGDLQRLQEGTLPYHTFLDDARLKLKNRVTSRQELARILNNPKFLMEDDALES